MLPNRYLTVTDGTLGLEPLYGTPPFGQLWEVKSQGPNRNAALSIRSLDSRFYLAPVRRTQDHEPVGLAPRSFQWKPIPRQGRHYIAVGSFTSLLAVSFNPDSDQLTLEIPEDDSIFLLWTFHWEDAMEQSRRRTSSWRIQKESLCMQ